MPLLFQFIPAPRAPTRVSTPELMISADLCQVDRAVKNITRISLPISRNYAHFICAVALAGSADMLRALCNNHGTSAPSKERGMGADRHTKRVLISGSSKTYSTVGVSQYTSSDSVMRVTHC